MDEIIIDDKRYISSKRAAHLTGYAKDYVSQLCREGRVPARLVGRAWYVLETAIQDHRFGGGAEAPIELESRETVTQPVLPERWDAARYSIPESAFLPELKKHHVEVSIEPAVTQETLPIEESWGEFFTPADEPVVVEEVVLSRDVPPQRPVTDIRAKSTTATVSTRGIAAPRRKRQHRLAMRVFTLALMVSAALSASIAALNSGFFDAYLISASRARVITGFSVYKKGN